MIMVPFVVYYQVDQNTDADSPKGLITAGISVIGMALMAKIIQTMKSLFLREPIRGSSYWLMILKGWIDSKKI